MGSLIQKCPRSALLASNDVTSFYPVLSGDLHIFLFTMYDTVQVFPTTSFFMMKFQKVAFLLL